MYYPYLERVDLGARRGSGQRTPGYMLIYIWPSLESLLLRNAGNRRAAFLDGVRYVPLLEASRWHQNMKASCIQGWCPPHRMYIKRAHLALTRRHKTFSYSLTNLRVSKFLRLLELRVNVPVQYMN
jgi:hypothetical protein